MFVGINISTFDMSLLPFSKLNEQKVFMQLNIFLAKLVIILMWCFGNRIAFFTRDLVMHYLDWVLHYTLFLHINYFVILNINKDPFMLGKMFESQWQYVKFKAQKHYFVTFDSLFIKNTLVLITYILVWLLHIFYFAISSHERITLSCN